MRNAVVIGAGLSGLMGALALADAGKRPYVIAKGQGATHWTSGTIDIWGAAGDRTLREALQELIDARPDHPYAKVGIAGVEDAIARFRALTEAARYPYVGSLDRNVLLPTAVGALRPAAFFPATMAAGDTRLGGELLIAGFHELRDFFPPMAAANLSAQGIPARGIYLNLPPSTNRNLDFNSRNFADLFDQPAFRADVGRQLREARGNATRIGLPAVLGVRDPLGVVQDLQQITGAQIFEIPTIPASVPGQRLYEIFRKAIVAAGGRLQIGGWVVRGESENGELKRVYNQAAARELAHQADVFLLATGGIAGGGVRTDHQGNIWETALGLPLQAPSSRTDWFASRFLSEQGHPIYRAGISVDEQMHPQANGQVIYRNLTAAGAALAGCDPVRERCYSGMAIATGWRAGTILAQS